jgi:hypothetical protein
MELLKRKVKKMKEVNCDKCGESAIDCCCEDVKYQLDFFEVSYWAYYYGLTADEFASMLVTHNVNFNLKSVM